MSATAKIIADSVSEHGIRITTLEIEMPRYLLAQFNTHRMFSRSAQSSRAVPVEKMIERIKADNLVPKFANNQSGMQAGEPLTASELDNASFQWYNAKKEAVHRAEKLIEIGVHKQWANRLLEPFSTVKVVVTATEWSNFFKLRLDHAVQPEMQELAQAMKTAMDESEPETLGDKEWHLPYVDWNSFNQDIDYETAALISAARCARVSYLNHDNSEPDIEKDLELAERLMRDGHWSPFEHQAKPISEIGWEKGVTHIDKKSVKWSGNFCGWIQHRQLLEEKL